jgi:acyl carrier protein
MKSKLCTFIKDELIEYKNIDISEDTNLLELGLDSIKMMRLVAYIEEEFNTSLIEEFIDPFEMSSISKIEQVIKNSQIKNN